MIVKTEIKLNRLDERVVEVFVSGTTGIAVLEEEKWTLSPEVRKESKAVITMLNSLPKKEETNKEKREDARQKKETRGNVQTKKGK